MALFNSIFKVKKPIIGALHFGSLLGIKGCPGINKLLDNAKFDLEALESGGVDAVIIENNYDFPHQICVGPEIVASMTYLGGKLSDMTKLPLGVSVLWNAYKAGLSIAKVIGARFIRIPAFVDDVRTSYGDVMGVANDVLPLRVNLDAEEIAIFADIQVKHSEMLDKNKPLVRSAREAEIKSADGIIVTGQWTGNAPQMKDLEDIKNLHLKTPLIIGSGVDEDNIENLLQFADGVIVGTALKSGSNKDRSVEINIKGYNQRVDERKVHSFMSKVKFLRGN